MFLDIPWQGGKRPGGAVGGGTMAGRMIKTCFGLEERAVKYPKFVHLLQVKA